MAEYIPIKIKTTTWYGDELDLGDHIPGSHKYPDFGKLQIVMDTKVTKWAYYVMVHCPGAWYFDNKSPQHVDSQGSPFGTWYMVLLVSEEFAGQAVAMYPDLITVLTELDFEDFYNNRVAYNFPEQDIDTAIVNGIIAKQNVGGELTDSQLDAINENTNTPGIRPNKRKTWSAFKSYMGITIG